MYQNPRRVVKGDKKNFIFFSKDVATASRRSSVAKIARQSLKKNYGGTP